MREFLIGVLAGSTALSLLIFADWVWHYLRQSSVQKLLEISDLGMLPAALAIVVALVLVIPVPSGHHGRGDAVLRDIGVEQVFLFNGLRGAVYTDRCDFNGRLDQANENECLTREKYRVWRAGAGYNIGTVGEDGAVFKIVEFSGPGFPSDTETKNYRSMGDVDWQHLTELFVPAEQRRFLATKEQTR